MFCVFVCLFVFNVVDKFLMKFSHAAHINDIYHHHGDERSLFIENAVNRNTNVFNYYSKASLDKSRLSEQQSK